MMRMPRIDLQTMYYANYLRSEDDYVLDADGNKILDYTDEDGTKYYRKTGTTHPVYDTPVEFKGTISSQLNEMHAREFGVDQSSIYAYIECGKGELPLKYGSKIWKNTPVSYLSDGSPDYANADYTVVGLMDEYIPEDFFLLQRNNVSDNVGGTDGESVEI